MADPRVGIPVEERLKKSKEHLSPLMRAKQQAQNGEKVNACPFGCTIEDLDDQGYCRHLVGFTIPGNRKLYEPLVMKRGRRVVQVARDKMKMGELAEDGQEDWVWGPPQYEQVQKTDTLIDITCSARVYRDIPVAPKK